MNAAPLWHEDKAAFESGRAPGSHVPSMFIERFVDAVSADLRELQAMVLSIGFKPAEKSTDRAVLRIGGRGYA